MYQVYCDNLLLYDDRIENLKIFNAKLELELNKTGSFTFTIYSNHPYFNFIKKLKSIITVYQDDFLLFRGRILNDEIGFHNEKQISCEGELSFLLDSIIRPYAFQGSITEFMQMLLDAHNSQVEEAHQFSLGNVTVIDANDYITRESSDYENTWNVLNKSLLDMLGGFIQIRFENNARYIDYLAELSTLSSQTVEFSKNLLELKRIRKGEDIATALIPLGAKLKDEAGNETGERLTISEVNDGIDYIYDQEAVDAYGWIFSTNTWEDVTLAGNLLTKAQAHLASLVASSDVVELSAADMATIDASVTSFHLGTLVNVISNPHGIEDNMLVSKLSIDLMNPASNKLTLGGVLQTLTGSFYGISSGQGDLYTLIEKGVLQATEAAYNMEQNLQSTIEQTEQNIIMNVSENYYLKDETESLVSSLSTQIEQTANSFEIQFNQFSADLAEVATGADAEFEEIKKYIRFIDGKILLGEVGNEIELHIANEKISFVQDGAEVAYFSNHKLHVTDGEYTNSLRLGSFAFIPRDNGNLSFKKVT